MIGHGQFRSAYMAESSESDTVTKCRPARAYMRVIYTPLYDIHAIYAIERFIFNIFCVNRRITLIL